MSLNLIAAVESVLSNLTQEVHKEASVLVQFAAGDWHKLKAALAEAKAALEGTAAPVGEGDTANPPSSLQEPAGAAPVSPADGDPVPETSHEEGLS